MAVSFFFQVICSVCDTEQPVTNYSHHYNYSYEMITQCFYQVAQVCSNCGVNMGEYFCNICKFYDDNVNKF